MARFHTSTIKYFKLAIDNHLPLLNKLIKKNKGDEKIIKKLESLIEIYTEIASKISDLNLNHDSPSRFLKNEPHEVNFELNDKMIKNLSQLTLRLLNSWKDRKNELENMDYLTDNNKTELWDLEELIMQLDGAFNNGGKILARYKDSGIIEFPGEKIKHEAAPTKIKGIFPQELIKTLPKDIQGDCNDFNFNFCNNKAKPCVLILRRILPLAIVRKFQQLDRESEVIEEGGDHIGTLALIGKIEGVLKTKRIYKEIMNYKVLLDSSQHSFTLKATITDAEGAGVRIRLLLEDIFD